MEKFKKILWWACQVNGIFAFAAILNGMGVLTSIMLVVSLLTISGWAVLGMLQYGMHLERKRNGSKNT